MIAEKRKLFLLFLSSSVTFLLPASGMIAVAITPNMKIAAVCSSYMYSLFHLFAGFVITQVNMPGWWYALNLYM